MVAQLALGWKVLRFTLPTLTQDSEAHDRLSTEEKGFGPHKENLFLVCGLEFEVVVTSGHNSTHPHLTVVDHQDVEDRQAMTSPFMFFVIKINLSTYMTEESVCIIWGVLC